MNCICEAACEAPAGGTRPIGRPRIDLAGRRVGRWLVVAPVTWDALGVTAWQCRCACGVERVVTHRDLGKRRTFSCGCSPRGRPRTADELRRERQILAARRRGETLAAIGARYHISRQRVDQILAAARGDLLCGRPA